jgi:hypothetical protein
MTRPPRHASAPFANGTLPNATEVVRVAHIRLPLANVGTQNRRLWRVPPSPPLLRIRGRAERSDSAAALADQAERRVIAVSSRTWVSTLIHCTPFSLVM